MSTPPPNNSNQPPKKPTDGAPKPSAGGAGGQPQKPAQPGAQRPAAPGPKPTAAGAPKPGQPAPKPAQPAAKKPAPAKNKFSHIDANTLQLARKVEDLGFLDGAQIEALYEDLRTSDLSLGDLAIQRNLLNEEQLLQAQAEIHGMRIANLEDMKPTPAAVKLVMKNIAELYKLVPITYESDTLTVAMSDPNNMQSVEDLKSMLGIKQVQAILGPPKQVQALLTRAYSNEKEETISSVYAQIEADESIGANTVGRANSIDISGEAELQAAAPVRKLINMVLLMAIRDHASDIHFEPFEDEYKMRYRCDGVLYEMVPPPRHLATAIASRIKVMANLDIAERRMPQDGRIELNVGGNPVDMRVSVLPTLFGESVVIRVLDRTNVGLSLDRIGMAPDLLGDFRAIIRKPNGIVFVTGPTGAGKTTTLYSALSELNEVDTKLITTEDPVEYEIDGIVQCPINHEIDVTFASALRAILRQDPDVILVGEVRDLETASIAIQASLTGHLVFSTLHTNDAPS
ncbi:MAG: GspE/PulE family protein, partial [Gemmata sp.]